MIRSKNLLVFAWPFLAVLLLLVFNNAKATSALAKIDDFSSVSELSLTNNIPIVLLIEQSGCHYCEIVSEEFLHPLQNSNRFKDKAIFRRISLDSGETITSLNNTDITTDAFCEEYGAKFTPTVLFLDGNGNSLTQKILGMSSRDYYGYELEKSILKAYQSLNLQ